MAEGRRQVGAEMSDREHWLMDAVVHTLRGRDEREVRSLLLQSAPPLSVGDAAGRLFAEKPTGDESFRGSRLHVGASESVKSSRVGLTLSDDELAFALRGILGEEGLRGHSIDYTRNFIFYRIGHPALSFNEVDEIIQRRQMR